MRNKICSIYFFETKPDMLIIKSVSMLKNYHTYKAEISVDLSVRRTASDYDLILNYNGLLISVLKIESLSLKYDIEI